MLHLSLPCLDERGRGAPAACADLIRADPAFVPMVEPLAARSSFFCEVSFRPRRRCLPRRFLAQATLSLGGDYRASNAKRITHGAKVSDSTCCSARENLVAACSGDASTLSKSVNGQICVL